MLEQQVNMRTSGQLDPKCKIQKSKCGAVQPYVINGCTVSFSSSLKDTDKIIKTVKEILLASYRIKIVRN